MRHIIRILIILLFALSVFWGVAQEVVMPQAFSTDHYPYWWGRAEMGLPLTWDRLEQTYGEDVSR